MQSQGSPAGPKPKGHVNLSTLHSRSVIASVNLSKNPRGASVGLLIVLVGKAVELVVVVVVQLEIERAGSMKAK